MEIVKHVRCLPGAKKFFRGGHGFDEDGRTVRLAPELYEVLRVEKRLALDDPRALRADEVAALPLLELVDNCPSYDHAWNASRDARLAVARLKAENAALQAEVERAELEKQQTELKAKVKALKEPKSK